MPKACNVPTRGSDSGKYSLAKTSPVTVLYRKKSYHSIVVPIVLAITARRNCTRCSSSVSASGAVLAVVIEAPPPGSRNHRLLGRAEALYCFTIATTPEPSGCFNMAAAPALVLPEAWNRRMLIRRQEEGSDAADQAYRVDYQRARQGSGVLQGGFWHAGDPTRPERRSLP